MDKSRTYPGHGKDLSWTLDDFGLLILGRGHCLGTTVGGQFKILPHRAASSMTNSTNDEAIMNKYNAHNHVHCHLRQF